MNYKEIVSKSIVYNLGVSISETMEKLTAINNFRVRKTTISSTFWSDQDFKGTVVNRALLSLPGGSREITLTFHVVFLVQSFVGLAVTNKNAVFSKNKRGYRLTAKNKRFWSLLILLLSVASIRRKLLKTIHTEERSANCKFLNLYGRYVI